VNQMAVMLGFLAAPAHLQSSLLPTLASDRGDSNFDTDPLGNPLLLMVAAYLEFFHHRDDEPWKQYLERLGLPEGLVQWPSSLEELNYLLGTLDRTDAVLWSRKSLERKPVWRVARRLAGVVLAELEWSAPLDGGEVQALVDRYTLPLRTLRWEESPRDQQ
jgi:hypothetical protein